MKIFVIVTWILFQSSWNLFSSLRNLLMRGCLLVAALINKCLVKATFSYKTVDWLKPANFDGFVYSMVLSSSINRLSLVNKIWTFVKYRNIIITPDRVRFDSFEDIYDIALSKRLWCVLQSKRNKIRLRPMPN